MMERNWRGIAFVIVLGLGAAGCAVDRNGELIVLDGLWSVRSAVVFDNCPSGAAERLGLLPDLVSIENNGLIWMRVYGSDGFSLAGDIETDRGGTLLNLDGSWDNGASIGGLESVFAHLDATYRGSIIEGSLQGSVTLDQRGRPLRCEVQTQVQLRRA